MAKLSISFETTTDEKKDMTAILNFMLAINGQEIVTTPTVQEPVKEKKIKQPKSEPKIVEELNDHAKVEEEEEAIKETETNVVEDVKETEEKTPEQIKAEKNAKRREAYRKNKEPETKVEEEVKGTEATKEDAPEVNKTVEEEKAPTEQTAQEVDGKAVKIDMQNKVRTLMAHKGEEGHREEILKFLRGNGIKGLNAMALEQLHKVYDFLNEL